MGAFVNRSGMRYGRWTVLDYWHRQDGRIRWLCRCDCGAEAMVMGQGLRSGTSTSCGCYHMERLRQKGRNATHGMTKTSTYESWFGMKRRCLNPKNHAYDRYGGRGITVCERWLKFENFLVDMGQCPDGLSIERIDNEKGYEPGNCKWATRVEQARNRRTNVRAFYSGQSRLLIEISEMSGMKYSTVYYRAMRGLPL